MSEESEHTTLYHLLVPTTGTLYIRNFCDKGDKPLPTTTAQIHTIYPIHRIEVTLLPLNQNEPPSAPTIQKLTSFTKHALQTNRSFVCSKQSPLTYVAQIDWSLITFYTDINKLIDSISCRQGLVYHLALTNIVPGTGLGFRSSELYITSTGTTRLKLPIHAFMDESLATYLYTLLPCSLTEVCITDTIPVDSTTLSWACRNLARLLERRAGEIRRLTIPLGLPHLSTIIPSLPRLYDLTLTGVAPVPSSNEVVMILSRKVTSITILTLPCTSFPIARNTLAHLPRLEELHLTSSADVINPFTHLSPHSLADFQHIRCLSYSGNIPSFFPLLSTLFPSPCLSSNSPLPTPRPSFSSNTSIRRPETPSSRPQSRSSTNTKRLINLKIEISSLTSKHDMSDLLAQIYAYFPKGVDIVQLHVKEWGIGEPKGGKWWTRTRLHRFGGGKRVLPGRVMSDFTHPCGFELGCKVKRTKLKRRKSEKGELGFGFGKWIGKLWTAWRK